MHCSPTIASESAAMAESTQHKLDRVRPPRVQITYDVEIGNAIEKKELPLVVGILADLSGKPDTPPAKLVERRFVDIDRDNFNEILSSISPRATLQVDNTKGGGAVEGLPAHTFRTSSGDLSLKCPTEVAITDRREKELNDLGFISLCHKKNSDVAVFFGGQTTNKARLYNTNEANANARLSAMLPYVLAASRFAHYLKVIMRDKVGSFMTRDNVQTYLNNWIADYVLINDNAPQEIKAQYPLREARVDVSEVAGKPGAYRATVFLRPHFQLEELSASIRLVANLPPPVAA
ncbi:TPA: type VI secretion system contractile sheath large subunit [Pseudomonas aeruginosa]